MKTKKLKSLTLAKTSIANLKTKVTQEIVGGVTQLDNCKSYRTECVTCDYTGDPTTHM